MGGLLVAVLTKLEIGIDFQLALQFGVNRYLALRPAAA